jgi:CDP-4-dehydro-6-deoxyglucose reductase, E1
MRIKLQESTFLNEYATKLALCDFVMRSEFLSMSSECIKFEANFASWHERSFAAMVNSGSSANLVLIQALLNSGRLKRGDKVAVSALTWATNIMPLIQLGLIPRLVDCELNSLNVSRKKLEDAIKHDGDIKALFITNTLGFCDDLDQVADFCRGKNILLIEDNCESLGSVHKGKLLGNYGLASTFSFFVGHHLSAIEGGMVCTDDEELSYQMTMCRAHGWDRNLPLARQTKLRAENSVDDFYSKYTFYDLGYNVRPTEINGFIGNLQLTYLDEIVKRRSENFKAIRMAIGNDERLIQINASHMDVVSNFAVPIIAKEANVAEKFKIKLVSAGIEIRPMIAGNMYRQPFFKKYCEGSLFPENAELIHLNGLYFGNHPQLSNADLEFIIDTLKSV